jgi:hypothetical protein
MLLRLDAGGPRRCFAEAEKAADLIAQLSHGMQIGWIEYGGHKFISYYDTIASRYKVNLTLRVPREDHKEPEFVLCEIAFVPDGRLFQSFFR